MLKSEETVLRTYENLTLTQKSISEILLCISGHVALPIAGPRRLGSGKVNDAYIAKFRQAIAFYIFSVPPSLSRLGLH